MLVPGAAPSTSTIHLSYTPHPSHTRYLGRCLHPSWHKLLLGEDSNLRRTHVLRSVDAFCDPGNDMEVWRVDSGSPTPGVPIVVRKCLWMWGALLECVTHREPWDDQWPARRGKRSRWSTLYSMQQKQNPNVYIYIYNSTIFYINIHAYSLMVFNSLQYHVYQVSLLSLDPLHTSYNWTYNILKYSI